MIRDSGIYNIEKEVSLNLVYTGTLNKEIVTVMFGMKIPILSMYACGHYCYDGAGGNCCRCQKLCIFICKVCGSNDKKI